MLIGLCNGDKDAILKTTVLHLLFGNFGVDVVVASTLVVVEDDVFGQIFQVVLIRSYNHREDSPNGVYKVGIFFYYSGISQLFLVPFQFLPFVLAEEDPSSCSTTLTCPFGLRTNIHSATRTSFGQSLTWWTPYLSHSTTASMRGKWSHRVRKRTILY